MSELRPAETADALSPAEAADLARLESAVGTAVRSFVAAGVALEEIRRRRLYRQTHASFEAYCQDRWDYTRAYAAYLIAAADVVNRLSTTVDTLPATERQARELARLPTPEQQAAAWLAAVKTASGYDGRVTALMVRYEVDRLLGPVPEAEPVDEDDPADGLRRCRVLADALDVALSCLYGTPEFARECERHGLPPRGVHGWPPVLAVRDAVRAVGRREVTA